MLAMNFKNINGSKYTNVEIESRIRKYEDLREHYEKLVSKNVTRDMTVGELIDRERHVAKFDIIKIKLKELRASRT